MNIGPTLPLTFCMKLITFLLHVLAGAALAIEPAVPGYTPTLRLDVQDAGIIHALACSNIPASKRVLGGQFWRRLHPL